MRIAVLTSLYPSSVRPNEGIFAERRWSRMRARGHAVKVVQPLPMAPPFARTLGRADWDEIRRTPRIEHRGGLEVERPRYLHVPLLARASARAFARCGVRAILASGRPDVVIADYAWPAAAAAPWLARERVPFVIHGRGSDVLQVAGEAGLGAELARHLALAGHWCAVSRDLVETMDRLAGRPGQGVLVPNGVDDELFRPRDRSECRRELGLAGAGKVVLCAGHLIERKDPSLALATFAALPETLRASARLVFVGRGPLEGSLRDEARARGLAAQVDLAGEVAPEVLARWYGAADALLLTSRREGRPNVVIEALSSGLPVVATRAGGTAELLDGLEGSLADSREPQAVAALLARALERPPSAESLRARVSGLTWDASLDALERCLAGAIADVERARP